MNNRNEKIRNILVPILSVIIGLVLGAILMLSFGYNPITGYGSMLDAALGNQRSIGETLRQATPLIFTALGFSVANSAGFFNIGLSGQALAGWITSVWVALLLPELPKLVLLPLAVLLGALAGAVAAAIPSARNFIPPTSPSIMDVALGPPLENAVKNPPTNPTRFIIIEPTLWNARAID